MSPDSGSDSGRQLARLRVVHTVVWALLVVVIFAIVPLAMRGHFAAVLICIAIVALEGLVLARNGWVCPLTTWAARHCDQPRHLRPDNFDIYIPAWLARHNQRIFGTVFAISVVIAFLLWLWA